LDICSLRQSERQRHCRRVKGPFVGVVLDRVVRGRALRGLHGLVFLRLH
jgi:hypothetical protein